MPTPRQFRAAIIVLAALIIGLICASADGAFRRGLSCPAGGCSVVQAPVQKETPQLQRPTVRSHKHVQRYRGRRIKVWRVWGVRRRVLFSGVVPR